MSCVPCVRARRSCVGAYRPLSLSLGLPGASIRVRVLPGALSLNFCSSYGLVIRQLIPIQVRPSIPSGQRMSNDRTTDSAHPRVEHLGQIAQQTNPPPVRQTRPIGGERIHNFVHRNGQLLVRTGYPLVTAPCQPLPETYSAVEACSLTLPV